MIFRQYIWIINTLRAYKRLTFEEISRKWQDAQLPAHAAPAPLPARDCHHRKLHRLLLRHPPHSGFPE